MSVPPYYPRYHSNALRGMAKLSLEQRGAYNLILDLLYEEGGPIEDNDDWLGKQANCSSRKWRAVKLSLEAAGKITLAGGFISNARAAIEIDKLARLHLTHVENGAKGGEKSGAVRRKNSRNIRETAYERAVNAASTSAEKTDEPNESSEVDEAGLSFSTKQLEPEPESIPSKTPRASSQRAPPSPSIGGGARVARTRQAVQRRPVRTPSESEEAFEERMAAYRTAVAVSADRRAPPKDASPSPANELQAKVAAAFEAPAEIDLLNTKPTGTA